MFLEKPFSVAAATAVGPRPPLGFDLYEFALSLWRRKLYLALCGLLGMVAVLGLAKFLPHRYTAMSEILVDPRDLRVLDKEVTPKSVATDSGITIVESQVAVLSSNTVLKRAIDKLNLEADPEFNGTSGNAFARAMSSLYDELMGPKPVVTETVTLQTLKQRLTVVRPERTFVIQLTVSTEDEEKSVRIADAIVSAYLDDQAQYRSSSNEGAAEAIDAGLDGMKNHVNEAEEKIAKYKADHSLVLASGKLVGEQQLTDTNNQLALARTDTSRIKAQFDDIKNSKGKGESIPEVVASQTLVNLKKQLAAVSADRARLAAQLMPRHPALIALQEQERQVRADIDQEIKRILASISHDYDRAKQREDYLAKSVQKLQADMNESAVAQIELRELERDLDASRSLYEQSVTRSRETREQSRLNTSNVRVISSAIAAPTRSFPPRNVLLAPAGFMLGMFAGACLIARRQLNLVAPPQGSPEGYSRRRAFDVDGLEPRIAIRDADTQASGRTVKRMDPESDEDLLDVDEAEIEVKKPKSSFIGNAAGKKRIESQTRKAPKIRNLQGVDALKRQYAGRIADAYQRLQDPIVSALSGRLPVSKEIETNPPVGVNDNADLVMLADHNAAEANKKVTLGVETPVFDFRKVSELVNAAARFPSGMAIQKLASGVISARHGNFARQVREMRQLLLTQAPEGETGARLIKFESDGNDAFMSALRDALARFCADIGKKVLVLDGSLPVNVHSTDSGDYEIVAGPASGIDVLKRSSNSKIAISARELAENGGYDVIVFDNDFTSPSFDIAEDAAQVRLVKAAQGEKGADDVLQKLGRESESWCAIVLIEDDAPAAAVHVAS